MLAVVLEAVQERVREMEGALAADRAEGEGVAQELRACAAQEAEIQRRLHDRNEAVTRAEVRAQQLRDQEGEAALELGALAEKLGLEAEPREEPLDPEEASQLRQRIERLQKRREQLGPVNPLAKQEYDEALAHVEELERQRNDLETALRELRAFIRDTDRQIRETFTQTFEAAARNFEELAGHAVPGRQGPAQPGARGRRAQAGARRPVARTPATGRPRCRPRPPRRRPPTPRPRPTRAASTPTTTSASRSRSRPAGKSMKRLTLLVGRREDDDRDRVPVQRLPRQAVPVLHPRRGRGRARRPQHHALPRPAPDRTPTARSSSS